MKLKIYQAGESVLRRVTRPLSPEEIRSPATQQLIEHMRETMHDARGVGLAAPQVGQSLQLAVLEDRQEYVTDLSAELLSECDRAPVPFHVIINPQLALQAEAPAESVVFFEGCLSIIGYMALVPRALTVRVKCLNHRAEPTVIEARGWYARILQHEIGHLHGRLYIDTMEPRSFMTKEPYFRLWRHQSIAKADAAFQS